MINVLNKNLLHFSKPSTSLQSVIFLATQAGYHLFGFDTVQLQKSLTANRYTFRFLSSRGWTSIARYESTSSAVTK